LTGGGMVVDYGKHGHAFGLDGVLQARYRFIKWVFAGNGVDARRVCGLRGRRFGRAVLCASG